MNRTSMSASGYKRLFGPCRRSDRSTPESRPSSGNVCFAPNFVCFNPRCGPPGRCPRSSGFDPMRTLAGLRKVGDFATGLGDIPRRATWQGCRPVFTPTGYRHHHPRRKDDVSNDGSVCRVRANHDSGTHPCRPGTRQGKGEGPWKAQDIDAQASRSDMHPTGRWNEFQEDRPANQTVAWRCTAGIRCRIGDGHGNG